MKSEATTVLSRRKRREVCFGNPAMGITHVGWVTTLEDPHDDNGAIGGNDNYDVGCKGDSRIVAMVDVPPEQVPEGVLNMARSHRPFIQHVRVLITSPNTSTASSTTTEISSSRQKFPLDKKKSFAEEEISISALEEEKTEKQNHDNESNNDMKHRKNRSNKKVSSTTTNNFISSLANISDQKQYDLSEEKEEPQHKKSFIILFLFLNSNSAKEFVQDLHNKPYTTLEPDVRCSTHLVSNLEGIYFLADDSNNNNNNNEDHCPLKTSINNDQISPKIDETYDDNDYKNCAVCLEPILYTQMCENSSSLSIQQQQHGGDAIITTVCDHSFHVDCLLGWQDSPCPVCRYDGGFGNDESLLSKCHICGATENNYICLICGIVSCAAPNDNFTNDSDINIASSSTNSRAATSTASLNENDTIHSHQKLHLNSLNESNNSSLIEEDFPLHETAFHNCSTALDSGTSPSSNDLRFSNNISVPTSSHAHQHYRETLHAYALDTQTQYVWDFCGQGYVHRLLQNSNDGKLVEVHDPSNKTSNVRSSQPGYLSDAQESFMVHTKLEGFANQYYNLLKNQLEAQREYYEEILEQIRLNKNDNNHHKKQPNSPANLITALKQEKHQLDQQCMSLRRKYKNVSSELADLKSMNESLEEGKDQLKRQIIDAQKDREEARNMLAQCLSPLEEEVKKLMMQLELESSSSSTTQKEQPLKSSHDTHPSNSTHLEKESNPDFCLQDSKPAAKEK